MFFNTSKLMRIDDHLDFIIPQLKAICRVLIEPTGIGTLENLSGAHHPNIIDSRGICFYISQPVKVLDV